VSKPELVDLLTKMRRDKQYRAVVQSDPETALGRVTLTAAERDAIARVLARCPEQRVPS